MNLIVKCFAFLTFLICSWSYYKLLFKEKKKKNPQNLVHVSYITFTVYDLSNHSFPGNLYMLTIW